MPAPPPPPPRLCFVDAVGGALAAIAAAVAQALGRDAAAYSTVTPAALPEEVTTVLGEVRMRVPTVGAFSPGAVAGATVIFLGPDDAEPVPGATLWPAALHPAATAPGEDDALERLATARIVRDRLERRLS